MTQDIGFSSLKTAENQVKKPSLLPSPGLGEWIRQQGGTIVFTTYQNSRVFFLMADEHDQTHASERIVGSAMGLAVDRDKIWITNKEQAWRFANIGPRKIQQSEDVVIDSDAVFMPRWGLFLGGCDTHDVASGARHGGRVHELAFINTNFNCIAGIDGHYNFVPIWKPKFISSIGMGDRCHLNGMGTRDGHLAFVTACSTTDVVGSWREHKAGGGVLIDVASHATVASGFSMPHSPRWHEGKVWMHNSGQGDFGYVDLQEGRFVPVLQCPGFARGLTIVGHYAVIGLSTLRDNTFASGLPIKQRLESQNIEQRCGLLIVNLLNGKLEHWLTIQGVTELYDVAWLSGIKRPYTPGFTESGKYSFLVNIPDTPEFPLGQSLPQPQLDGKNAKKD